MSRVPKKIKIQVFGPTNKLEKEYDFTPQLTDVFSGEPISDSDVLIIAVAAHRACKKLRKKNPEKGYCAIGWPNQANHFAPILDGGHVHF